MSQRQLHLQNQDRQQKPMTAIQYKMNARKIISGRTPSGVRGFGMTATVAPEPLSSAEGPALARVTFGANAYTVAEVQGQIRLQVLCTRYAPQSRLTVGRMRLQMRARGPHSNLARQVLDRALAH